MSVVNTGGTKLDLDRVIFVGRTFEEYLDMFALTIDELKGKRTLDCPAGACSFTAGANKSGMDVTACDIAYDHFVDDLKNKGFKDVEHAVENIEKVKSNYIWDYFTDVDHFKSHRLNALEDCTDHMKKSPEKYVPATLPALPFENEEFDIILSAHFLFMYADRLDYQFHMDTINELLRVAKEEIRIFPLVDLKGDRYEYLDELLKHLDAIGCMTKEVKVPYEFQVNANTMLKIRKIGE